MEFLGTVVCLEATNWHRVASDFVYEKYTNYLAELSQMKCVEYWNSGLIRRWSMLFHEHLRLTTSLEFYHTFFFSGDFSLGVSYRLNWRKFLVSYGRQSDAHVAQWTDTWNRLMFVDKSSQMLNEAVSNQFPQNIGVVVSLTFIIYIFVSLNERPISW